MRQVSPLQVPPLERLARRICKAATAPNTGDAGTVIASFKQRSRIATVDAAVELAITKQWLRLDGNSYILTQAGAEMGRRSGTGQRTRRISPF
jgi:hypothetical protein